ncbi:lytic transglycosylase domain-containing protein [uncultured Succinivibrio sp.]|uniref:lytic transglycosylase domain-containing protein n=1 Tax=uncultured Succinivibrio sp. TaxID=540749 RepID=UPI0025E08B2B|nr:lytic transglycosylase domain-containing protein [uncultured Succinivibrio sp.]
MILNSKNLTAAVLGIMIPYAHAQVSLNVEENEIYAVPFNQENPVERRIDTLDVNKLSKYAYLLRANHMVMPSYGPKTSKEVKKRIKDWHKYITEAAETNLLPEELIKAVIEVESGAVVTAVSHCGAKGLMQLMPKTQSELGVKDPFDPNENISAGTRYLAQLLNMYDGDLSLALAAYNAGMGNVNKYGGIPPFEETQNFVKKVTAIYHRLQQENTN